MNKYLLSLFLFGLIMTERIYGQEGGSSEGGSSGEGSSSGGEGSDSDSEGSSGSESGSGSGSGSSGITPNYCVDAFTFTNESYAPNPYPLDICTQVSVWDEDPDGMYAMFSCNGAGTRVTKTSYSDSNCSTSVGTTTNYNYDANATAGDLGTFECDGTDYYFQMAVDCASSTPSGDTIYIVPYVCIFDGSSSKTISNEWQCDEDDDENKLAYFYTYRDTDVCDGDPSSLKNVTEDCTLGVYGSNVAGSEISAKLQSSDSTFECPGTGSGNTDDTTNTDAAVSILSSKNGLIMLAVAALFSWMY